MSKADARFVELDASRLDGLLRLVREIAALEGTLAAQAARARTRHRHAPAARELGRAVTELGRQSAELRARVNRTRMVPIGRLFRRFARLCAELATGAGKELELVFAGESIAVDARVSDELAEPLVHLVKNAIDHGLELPATRLAACKPARGRVCLEARREANALVIEVRDDGAGVDLALVRAHALELGLVRADELAGYDARATLELLFRPGFSTRERVSDVSGRGVGLDAARARVTALGGRMELESTPGRGSTGRLTLPLTTALVDALFVTAGDERYALALEPIVEVVRAPATWLTPESAPHEPRWRDAPIAIAHLGALVGAPRARSRAAFALVLAPPAGPLGILVDAVLARRTIVVERTSHRLGQQPGIVGGCLDETGAVVLVIDAAALHAAAQRAERAS